MARREIQDAYFRRARAEGYVARSAYKLIEIVERTSLIHRGDRVLDLGCAPGSWLQVAGGLVGAGGLVIGVDLNPTAITPGPNVRAIVGNVFQTEPGVLLEQNGGPFDAVLSDMAPRTSGGAGGSVDHFRSVALCRRVLELASQLLRPGGRLAMKVFEGEAYTDLLRETRSTFERARGFKPKASRDVSREMYIIGTGFVRT